MHALPKTDTLAIQKMAETIYERFITEHDEQQINISSILVPLPYSPSSFSLSSLPAR